MKPSVVFRRKINSLARRLGWSWAPAHPIKAWISPTTRCNLRCRTCARHFSHSRFLDMSEETYGIIRREILPGLGHVVLTGAGEPLLSPLLGRMIEDCDRQGAFIEMTTNATIWDEAIFQRLARCRARVIASVDGAAAETVEYVRPGLDHGVFLENLDRLAAVRAGAQGEKFQFYFNVVLLRRNLEELEAVVELAHRLGVDGIWFSNFSAAGHTGDFAEESLEHDPDVLIPALDRAAQRCEALGIPYLRPLAACHCHVDAACAGDGGRMLQCPLPWWAVNIEADGSVLPCCQWWPPVANIHDAPFGVIWNGSAYRKIRQTVNRVPLPEPCRRCILGERRF